MSKTMKLFIFEPYSWSYCGGAIGIIAETFDKAVDYIVQKDIKISNASKAKLRRERKIAVKAGADADYYDRRLVDKNLDRTYFKEHFSTNPKVFKEDHYDQWLLTGSFDVPGEKKERIVFENWNYA